MQCSPTAAATFSHIGVVDDDCDGNDGDGDGVPDYDGDDNYDNYDNGDDDDGYADGDGDSDTDDAASDDAGFDFFLESLSLFLTKGAACGEGQHDADNKNNWQEHIYTNCFGHK